MRSMAAAPSRPRKTIDDLMALPDEVRAELLEGEIYVTRAPLPLHHVVAKRVADLLEAWSGPRGRGMVFMAPVDVELPTGDVVQPDVFLVRIGAADLLSRVRVLPDLVVEVVSPSHPERDRFVKRARYALAGIPEYWIADPGEAAVEVFRLDGRAYVPSGWFRRGQTLRSPTREGLAVAIDDVFRGIPGA
jgi:Uma2 family endonuclease